MTVLADFGVNNPEKAHEKLWGRHGFPTSTRQNGVKVTAPVQAMQRTEHNREKARNFWKRNALGLEYEDTDKHVGGPSEDTEGKAIDATVAQDPTPLVYDPEIMEMLKSNAPLVARVPEEGQQGYKAVYNRLDSRDAPIGYSSETDSLDLLSQSREFSMQRDEVDMEIYVDSVIVSEFSDRATAHYMDLADTALGARVSEHAQTKEQTYLYGDPTQNIGDGGPGDSNAYEGLSKIYTDAGNDVDKSAVDITDDEELIKDIKAEIKKLLQGPYNISKGDLEIWTSHTLFDKLENGQTQNVRYGDENSFNYGFDAIGVSNVPVYASHNVDSHTYTDPNDETNTYTPGSEGDVFIVNRRATRFRSLMPLSTVPLAKAGFSDQMALGEFGALIDRANGHFGKYLYDYAV